MSDLQIALLLIGVVVVGGVLIFNWYQERRFRQQAAAAFQVPERDALLEPSRASTPATRIEPGLREPHMADTGAAHSDLSEPRLQAAAAAPALAPATAPEIESPVASSQPLRTPAGAPAAAAHGVPAAASTTSATPARAIAAAPYDELIEYRISLDGADMHTAFFADDINRLRSTGKHTRWLGLPACGDEWEEIQPWREAHYRKVQVTIQLADRNGAVHENELKALTAVLQSAAQTHGLTIDCDDIGEAVERAQSVDRFCVDVDVLIGLNIVARGEGAMPVAQVLREAEHAGLVPGVDGSFQLLDSRGEALYVLCNHDAEPFADAAPEQPTQAVTLQFDVPRVPDGLKVFDSMVRFGRKLANEVGGLLVDDNMRPLTDSGIEKIRQQLAGIYQRMEARGVPSGSRRALRLFS